MLINDGIPTKRDLEKVIPSTERLAKGPVCIVECFQEIPCDPCIKVCPKGAITNQGDINNVPHVDHEKCNGCGLCISICPGLAIFGVDMTYHENYALVKFPFEYFPLPEKGQKACALDRSGKELGWFSVEKVLSGGKKNRTYTISLKVPKELAMEVRNIREGDYK